MSREIDYCARFLNEINKLYKKQQDKFLKDNDLKVGDLVKIKDMIRHMRKPIIKDNYLYYSNFLKCTGKIDSITDEDICIKIFDSNNNKYINLHIPFYYLSKEQPIEKVLKEKELVLARNTKIDIWEIAVFNRYLEDEELLINNNNCVYCCYTGNREEIVFRYVIPYKGNEELLFTNNEPYQKNSIDE